jgi:hypothetical protein
MSVPEKSPSRSRVKRDLGERLRQVRTELYGEHGAPALARFLRVPERTWCNYENGVTIPGDILLELLTLTSAEPRWLLGGEGARFRSNAGDGTRQADSEGADRRGNRRAGMP